ncbi:hypothetical protein E2C01_041635 [Portunus trituberculatus]|uniref:Uncharacterized protein n=1 Tax=Portunus trituberculatus TaxID=210409 RepID=A0A5B7FR66_PORTR|nr:hypothetical protein [Portunus trituberculatus]
MKVFKRTRQSSVSATDWTGVFQDVCRSAAWMVRDGPGWSGKIRDDEPAVFECQKPPGRTGMIRDSV